MVGVKTMEPSIKPNNEGALDPVETGSPWIVSNTPSRRDSSARGSGFEFEGKWKVKMSDESIPKI